MRCLWHLCTADEESFKCRSKTNVQPATWHYAKRWGYPSFPLARYMYEHMLGFHHDRPVSYPGVLYIVYRWSIHVWEWLFAPSPIIKQKISHILFFLWQSRACWYLCAKLITIQINTSFMITLHTFDSKYHLRSTFIAERVFDWGYALIDLNEALKQTLRWDCPMLVVVFTRSDWTLRKRFAKCYHWILIIDDPLAQEINTLDHFRYNVMIEQEVADCAQHPSSRFLYDYWYLHVHDFESEWSVSFENQLFIALSAVGLKACPWECWAWKRIVALRTSMCFLKRLLPKFDSSEFLFWKHPAVGDLLNSIWAQENVDCIHVTWNGPVLR